MYSVPQNLVISECVCDQWMVRDSRYLLSRFTYMPVVCLRRAGDGAQSIIIWKFNLPPIFDDLPQLHRRRPGKLTLGQLCRYIGDQYRHSSTVAGIPQAYVNHTLVSLEGLREPRAIARDFQIISRKFEFDSHAQKASVVVFTRWSCFDSLFLDVLFKSRCGRRVA